MKILITGASGLLGCALAPYLQAQDDVVLRHGFKGEADYNADLRDKTSTWAMLDACQPDAIINLAALTNVDTCEKDPQQAYLLNVKTVENLTSWIKHRHSHGDVHSGHHSANHAHAHGSVYSPSDCYFVQISSDQVYDAPRADLVKAAASIAPANDDEKQVPDSGPFSEEQVRVHNTYAFSKIAAELASQQVRGCALRTNFFGKSARPGRVSFSDWLYQSLSSGQPIQVFDDVLFSPLSMTTLVDMIARIVSEQPQGVFNLGSREGMSKADFAFAFAQAAGLPTASMTRALSTQSQQIAAYRPKDMRMDNSRIEAVLDTVMPSLQEEINQCGRIYREPS